MNRYWMKNDGARLKWIIATLTEGEYTIRVTDIITEVTFKNEIDYIAFKVRFGI